MGASCVVYHDDNSLVDAHVYLGDTCYCCSSCWAVHPGTVLVESNRTTEDYMFTTLHILLIMPLFRQPRGVAAAAPNALAEHQAIGGVVRGVWCIVCVCRVNKSVWG